MRTAQSGRVCSHVNACACARQCEQSPHTCSSRLSIPFTAPTRWQSPPRCERHTPEHIQTPLPGGTVKPIYLSMASPVCLSGNPFHHSVIPLSVCLHSSVIIGQKSVTHTSSLEPIRLYTSLRRKPQGPHKDMHTHQSERTHLNYTFISSVEILPCFKHISTWLLLSCQMPDYCKVIRGFSTCLACSCDVNIHLPSAAIIRPLTGLVFFQPESLTGICVKMALRF